MIDTHKSINHNIKTFSYRSYAFGWQNIRDTSQYNPVQVNSIRIQKTLSSIAKTVEIHLWRGSQVHDLARKNRS